MHKNKPNPSMWDDMVIVVQCCFNPFQKYILYIVFFIFLVGGIPTPLNNMKVNCDDYSHYMEK